MVTTSGSQLKGICEYRSNSRPGDTLIGQMTKVARHIYDLDTVTALKDTIKISDSEKIFFTADKNFDWYSNFND